MMKLRAGGIYLTRDGQVVRACESRQVVRVCKSRFYNSKVVIASVVIKGSNGKPLQTSQLSFNVSTGECFGLPEYDIIQEIKDED